MDFYRIKERSAKNGVTEIYPDFRVCRSNDLMIRGKRFYAIWDEEAGLWSTDEYDVQRLIDKELSDYRDQVEKKSDSQLVVKYLSDFSSNSWLQFQNYVAHLTDNFKELDSSLTFKNSKVGKNDYVSRRLPYDLEEGDISSWEKLIDKLYEGEERQKIEWLIGSIVAGDSKTIQKFFVFYGTQGSGKSTVMNVIQWMFEGYWSSFVAKELTSNNNSFALEAFKTNPLIALDHDADLSKIVDNTKLNSLVSHEPMEINEKNKPKYMMRFNSMLVMGSNEPVKITNSKSGLIRRLIDINPTGKLHGVRTYQTLMNQVKFELGAIAHHCHEVYLSMGKDYYSGYKPIEMMLQTDVFFNFIEAHFDIFKKDDGVSLQRAYDLYRAYIEETGVERGLPQYKMREELKNYFDHFDDRKDVGNERIRSYYSGFKTSRFKAPVGEIEKHMFRLVLDSEESIFDKEFSAMPAQYSKADGSPNLYWSDKPRIVNGKEKTPRPDQVCQTVLSDLDTTQEHYVQPTLNHIVIDFDLKDGSGEKSAERNLEVASQWPPTYAEFSKSGAGIHLHYTYDGDATELSRIYDEGIEIKVFVGDSSLRRRLSKCNNIPIATLKPGQLPVKERKPMNSESIKSERNLRELIERNLRKEIHPATKPSMDFIHKILEDAYASDLVYDLTDMRPRILYFANNSTHQAMYCIKLINQMKFQSREDLVAQEDPPVDDRIVFYDVEVFPNLLVVNWKYEGVDKVVRMINPDSRAIEELMKMKLVGFNCRRYDNHILWGRYMGFDNMALYQLSQKIIIDKTGFFGEAYNLSYTDIYDFSSKKQGLKKFQIELGIHHQELDLPWDEPVPEERWIEVAEYCDNDVVSTEAVFHDRYQDFVARQILAKLSGLSVNDTTNAHTTKIVFGNERKPQKDFVYTDLSEMFPGYTFDYGKSLYKGEEVGEGGYVYAEPGLYKDVAVLDIASMHPTSIEELNLFGDDYTRNFSAIKNARVAIKRKDYDTAKLMLDGALAPYLGSDEDADALSYALKIAINSVYGLTAARFENPFRDPRNKDNIVAKRGALFMVDLKEAVQAQGYQVVHIKTDSIKIPNADKKIIEFVMEFGNEYGYEFEHEATYERFGLVNDAVYVALVQAGRKPEHWEAVGAQFQHPYVFKKLFTGDPIIFRDLCETKTVTTSLWLDFTPDGDEPMVFDEEPQRMRFVGRAGSFVPVTQEGALLLRKKDEEFHAAAGSKGHRWLEAEMYISKWGEDTTHVDFTYHNNLADNAFDTLSKFGDVSWFLP